MPDRPQSTVQDLARRIVPNLTPEATARIAKVRAEAHDILAALNMTSARAERLRACAQKYARTKDHDLPEGIAQWQPGDSLNMPGNLGGEYFETSGEAHFWGELDLQGLCEELAEIASNLTRDLKKSDPYNALTRAEELLARLPGATLDALRARLAELEA